ncbi:MAG: hypothetical protein JWM04_1737 [Verrucomicrobiales bacterium]|nr:hypothetical protein [Verrucomicrobiales bacterium]
MVIGGDSNRGVRLKVGENFGTKHGTIEEERICVRKDADKTRKEVMLLNSLNTDIQRYRQPTIPNKMISFG